MLIGAADFPCPQAKTHHFLRPALELPGRIRASSPCSSAYASLHASNARQMSCVRRGCTTCDTPRQFTVSCRGIGPVRMFNACCHGWQPTLGTLRSVRPSAICR